MRLRGGRAFSAPTVQGHVLRSHYLLHQKTMSVGFGFSVGNSLAALNPVGTVNDALRETSEARTSFRSLIDEPYALESALLRVKRLDVGNSLYVEKLALRTINVFYTKVQKYQPYLQQDGTNTRLKGAWARIKWATCRKGDVDTLRAEIRGHTSSIEVL